MKKSRHFRRKKKSYIYIYISSSQLTWGRWTWGALSCVCYRTTTNDPPHVR